MAPVCSYFKIGNFIDGIAHVTQQLELRQGKGAPLDEIEHK